MIVVMVSCDERQKTSEVEIQSEVDQMKKQDNKQCLLDTHRTLMVNKENYN